jgi:hypothetical protein
MSESFDPYHVWLGIPPQEQPANHYRLLTTSLFEGNPDVIDNAADRQTAHLRNHQSGKYAKFSEQLLNEVAAARVCLLDPKKKAAYDEQLRARISARSASAIRRAVAAPPAQPAPPHPAPFVPRVSPPTAAALSTAQSLPTKPAPAVPDKAAPAAAVAVATAPGTARAAPAKAAPEPIAATPVPEGDWVALLGNVDGQAHGAHAKSVAATRRAGKRSLTLFAAVAALLIVAAGGGLFILFRGSADGSLTFDWPNAERTGAKLTVDGVMVPIPGGGPWEYRCTPGVHEIVVSRPAYQAWNSSVKVSPGQPLAVAVDWTPAAVLVLNWPVKDRAGAQLLVDGRQVVLSDQQPIELPVEPGNRVVHIVRPGTEALEINATVAADARKMVLVSPVVVDAKLVIRLPEYQRDDVQISIDGFPKSGEPTAEGERYTLSLGQHTVRITRPGFFPFKQVVDLVASGNLPINPVWRVIPTKVKPPSTIPKIVQTPPVVKSPAVDTPPVVAPATSTADAPPEKKLPVPATEEQMKIAQQLDRLYKPTHSEADAAKASELYELAKKDEGNAAERYMLLLKGADLAVEGGDIALAFQGIDVLFASYEINPIEAKQRLLDKAVKLGSTPDQLTSLVTAAEQLLDDAMAADRYADALAIAATATRALVKRPLEAQFRKDTEELLARRRRDIRMLEPQWAAAQKAQAALEQNAADGDANLALGRWYCFYKSDWPRGLPLLAKGSDGQLKTLALTELKPPAEGEEQAHLADGWWDQGSKELAVIRDVVRAHAAELYTASLPNLTEALRKIAVQRRIAEIANLQHPGAGPNKPAKPAKAIVSRWMDILRLADTDRDARKGIWKRIGADVGCQPLGLAVLDLPIELDDNYNLAVEFTRLSGVGEIGIVFPVGFRNSKVMLNMREGQASGLDTVEGRRPIDPMNPTARRPGGIENRRRHQLVISVRLIDPDQASIDVYMDGNQYLPHWTGKRSALAGGWGLPAKHAGIGGYNSGMVYHSVAVQKVTPPSASGPAPLPKISTVPTLKSSPADLLGKGAGK